MIYVFLANGFEEIEALAPVDLLRRAGAAQTAEDIAVTPDLCVQGLKYHAYMRHRLLLSRLVPMLGVSPDYRAIAGADSIHL